MRRVISAISSAPSLAYFELQQASVANSTLACAQSRPRTSDENAFLLV